LISDNGTPVALDAASREVAPGKRRFQSFTYFEVFVRAPLSVLKGRYAFGVFHDSFALFVNSFFRSVFFFSVSPEKYLRGKYIIFKQFFF
jgi:hypothetical protein